MGGSDCDRYDGWVDESLPLLLERFKIQKRCEGEGAVLSEGREEQSSLGRKRDEKV